MVRTGGKSRSSKGRITDALRADAGTAGLRAVDPGATPQFGSGYVVPADRKWYRNWAITRLLIEQLEDMDLQWPAAAFDVAGERARVQKLVGGA